MRLIQLDKRGIIHWMFIAPIAVFMLVAAVGYRTLSDIHAETLPDGAVAPSLISTAKTYKNWTLVGSSPAQAPSSNEVFTAYACRKIIKPTAAIVKAEYTLSSAFKLPYEYGGSITDVLPSSVQSTPWSWFVDSSSSLKIGAQLSFNPKVSNQFYFYQESNNGSTGGETTINDNSVSPSSLAECS